MFDLVKIADWMSQNGSTVLFAGLAVLAVFAIQSFSVWGRIAKGVEKAFFTNWRLALLGATGIVLSIASGWTTWDGMRNFTGEPLLSFMVTFGIQGVMLIVAWLIGESFAAGMTQLSERASTSGGQTTGALNRYGPVIGALLMATLAITGAYFVDLISLNALAFAAIGLMLFAAIGLAAADIVRPYVQSLRVMLRSAVLWVMFLACMATSVFFSFDSLFSTIFPASERERAAELRAQNQVAGILADINQTMTSRQAAEADALFSNQGWTAYETQLASLAQAAQGATDEIERYFVQKMEERRRGIAEQQERVATAASREAGLSGKKISLTEELTRLSADRPGLAAEYTQHKSELDAKAKEVDAKRVEAMAEERGVEGTGKVGRGQFYRQRMAELGKIQDEYKIKLERTKDAEKRLATVQLRIEQIRRELAAIDGDIAQAKGEADTAKQRIEVAKVVGPEDQGAKVDPARVLPAFDRARTEFRQEPTAPRLAALQQQCANLLGAMAATPATKDKVRGIDCDPKQASEAAATLFAVNDGMGVFARQCAGGDKLADLKSTDALFGFSRKCLNDSGLPSKDTDALRTKINYAELNRDDKAHRFVVTWNAFGDGNRLAYLALAIAVAIDSLVFLSGLFGANAVRSPLSDVPSTKARSARQLEDMINAHLGEEHERYEHAKLLLHSLRPSAEPGYSLQIDLRRLTPVDAERIVPVLNAGSEIGAVKIRNEDHETYFVKGELAQYLASFVEKEGSRQQDAPAQLSHHSMMSELSKTIHIALLPDVAHNAEVVLHYVHPIEERHGFTGEVKFAEVEHEHVRVLRNAMNAGALYKRVQRAETDPSIYFVHGDFYKSLIRLRARLMSTAAYPTAIAGPQSGGAVHGGILHDADRKALTDQRAEAQESSPRPRIAPPVAPARPEPQPPAPAAQQAPVHAAEAADVSHTNDDGDDRLSHAQHTKFWAEFVAALDIKPELAITRLSSQETLDEAMNAWRALNDVAKGNHQLGRRLTEHSEEQDQKISERYSQLRAFAPLGTPAHDILEGAQNNVLSLLPALMLFPENGLIDFLIGNIERAASSDDGLMAGEQELLDTLRDIRHSLAHADLSRAEAWHDIGRVLRQLTPQGDDEPNYRDNVAQFRAPPRNQQG